jgi:hypothetical protein
MADLVIADCGFADCRLPIVDLVIADCEDVLYQDTGGSMKTLMLCVVLGVAAATSFEEIKLGTGVSLKEATPIASLTAKPKEYVGKTVRVDGVARAVCAEMGCWMSVVVDEADPASPTVRLKVDDGAIVFPMSAKGKKVSAQGVFQAVGAMDAESKEAAGEHAKQDPNASRQYQIKATGATIK